ncbi:unnamed protein product [Cuscuta campestris]|uniref:Uncharacterized protein n=1 Tax=Cuscuta campestris TaxID=132261 RepID=A0A484LE74_9ASTE|nr:unnamed protein product [Cuscuta campestris]
MCKLDTSLLAVQRTTRIFFRSSSCSKPRPDRYRLKEEDNDKGVTMQTGRTASQRFRIDIFRYGISGKTLLL